MGSNISGPSTGVYRLPTYSLLQVAAPVLEGYNHAQKALFERERKESVESITPRARGGGRGVHNRDVIQFFSLVTWAVVNETVI